MRNKVYPVGRLDYHSEGLMLLTNDGDFANGVLSTKSAIPKTYQVKVKGVLTADLSWANASGANVDIYRNGSYLTTTANDGAYTDSTGVKGGATFTYQVCEEGSSNCSNTITLNW